MSIRVLINFYLGGFIVVCSIFVPKFCIKKCIPIQNLKKCQLTSGVQSRLKFLYLKFKYYTFYKISSFLNFIRQLLIVTGLILISSCHLWFNLAKVLLSPCHNPSVIHTGGVPEAILTLSDHRYRGYEGCIGDVRIQDSGYVNLGQKSLSGKNVASCNR